MLERLRPFFFIFVVLFVSGQAEAEIPLDASVWGRIGPLVGLLVGVAWQLVDARDLADRLFFPAATVLIALVLHLINPGGTLRLNGLLVGLGTVVGLVLTEQWRRRSAAKVSDAPAEERPSPTASP